MSRSGRALRGNQRTAEHLSGSRLVGVLVQRRASKNRPRRGFGAEPLKVGGGAKSRAGGGGGAAPSFSAFPTGGAGTHPPPARLPGGWWHQAWQEGVGW